MHLRKRVDAKIAAIVVSLVAVVFSQSYIYVKIKDKDCVVICGENSAGTPTFRISGTVGARYPSTPHSSSCDCGDRVNSTK